MRRLSGFLIAALLVACTQPPVPEAQLKTTLPFFGDGYPAAGDPCRRIGESSETVEFLDHTAILVGCPEDQKGPDTFIADRNAVEVLRKDGFIVYSVPIGL